MLRPMSALDQRAWGAALSHRRDQPIKAEHLSLSLKETCLKGPIKRGPPPQQLRSAFWPGPGRARQFVRKVPSERDKVRHLVWIDVISLPDLFRPAPRRVEDTRG
jgi:hypothetical protein